MLSDDERETLRRWVRRRTNVQALALALRCRTMLGCAEGATDNEVAETVRVHPAAVGKWPRRLSRADSVGSAMRLVRVRRVPPPMTRGSG